MGVGARNEGVTVNRSILLFITIIATASIPTAAALIVKRANPFSRAFWHRALELPDKDAAGADRQARIGD